MQNTHRDKGSTFEIKEKDHRLKIFYQIKRNDKYSGVPIKRVGWNKHVGWKIMGNLINVLDGINVLVGNFWKI